jgi:hypothetical protein
LGGQAVGQRRRAAEEPEGEAAIRLLQAVAQMKLGPHSYRILLDKELEKHLYSVIHRFYCFSYIFWEYHLCQFTMAIKTFFVFM